MRYIRKRTEPAEFAAWKSACDRTWEDLDESRNRNRKQRIKDALLEEQGHLCCYCCRAIKDVQGHIEHLVPKKRHPKRQLDYANLLVSCDGISAPAAHCGHKKGEQELAVTPLRGDCAAFFRYTQDGQILPVVDAARHAAAEDTICKLGLGSADRTAQAGDPG